MCEAIPRTISESVDPTTVCQHNPLTGVGPWIRMALKTILITMFFNDPSFTLCAD